MSLKYEQPSSLLHQVVSYMQTNIAEALTVSIVLMMEAVSTSYVSIYFYETTKHSYM
jgi:hypothetical protein